MRRIAWMGLSALAVTIAFMATASGQTNGGPTPNYAVGLPNGYRDWPLISVATVGAPVSDMRAKLGNEVAMKAFRTATLPFPDGTIIARSPVTRAEASTMKIRFVFGETTVAATLDDSGTSKDFASLLPLEVELKDLFAREKSGDLPRALSEEGPRTHTYEVGDVVYWPPGSHVAVFYLQDGRTVTAGMIRLGVVDAGVDAFAPSASLRATIELAN